MKKSFSRISIAIVICFIVSGCKSDKKLDQVETKITSDKKIVIYQVFTRLFGNTKTANIPWGTLEENGVGKFSDFTEKALNEIKALGITHIWYTGVPHHALVTDYSDYGITPDDPDVVKGRAGSPYAVKDYYNVNPDLAEQPEKRLEEFRDLITRTHKAGLKLLIDIVPNHVARNYEGKSTPSGLAPFGASDDTSVAYSKHNNFYYIPQSPFQVPEWNNGYLPLGGENHQLADGQFNEYPAKWTGNGSRQPQPNADDWYETVKINYGVQPDGGLDFERLPEGYENRTAKDHYAYWQEKEVPDSWIKFRDIAFFWLEFGVDGFRFDMAEMVPVAFWSYLNSHIKMKNNEALILAEVYQPKLYRDYIHKGKMDYLYDKVELYDSLKHIIKGYGWTDHIPQIQEGLSDIEHHMLHFLENHDEQRLTSPDFAGDLKKGNPAMVVSSTISTSPTMIYFGQEVGEPAKEAAGFGSPTRTSIFDYIGVPHHQRWMNNKKFDGGQLSAEEKELRDFYSRLLNFTINSSALTGSYADIHMYNRGKTQNYNHRVLSFVRWSDNEKLIIVANFDAKDNYEFDLEIPDDIIETWQLSDGRYQLEDQLYGKDKTSLKIDDGLAKMPVTLKPLQSFIFQLKE